MNQQLKREYERYGAAIKNDGSKHKEFIEFMKWANKYETGGIDIRSRYQQERWLKKLNCSMLRLDGNRTINANIKLIRNLFFI